MDIVIFKKGKYFDTAKDYATAKTLTGVEKTEDIKDALEYGMEMQGYSFDLALEQTN